jgi:hypothetical protein
VTVSAFLGSILVFITYRFEIGCKFNKKIQKHSKAKDFFKNTVQILSFFNIFLLFFYSIVLHAILTTTLYNKLKTLSTCMVEILFVLLLQLDDTHHTKIPSLGSWG